MGRPKASEGANPVVAANIARIRKEKGMYRQALAQRVGVTYQQMHKYETGKNRVSAGTLAKLAEGLGVPVSDFFSGLPPTERLDGPLERFMAIAAELPPDELELLHKISCFMAERRAPDATA